MALSIFKSCHPPGVPPRLFWTFQAIFWAGVFLWRAGYNYISGYGLSMAGPRFVSLALAAGFALILAHVFSRTVFRRAGWFGFTVAVVVTMFTAVLHSFLDRGLFSLGHPKKLMGPWFTETFLSILHMNMWVFLCWVSLFWGLAQFSRAKGYEAAQASAPLAGDADMVKAETPDTHFWVKGHKRQIRIEADDIEVVEAVRDYVELQTSKATHLMRGKISDFEAQLSGSDFLRVHRSFIVNLAQVKALKTLEGGGRCVVMASGREVKIGRTYLSAVKEQLDF